MAYQEMIVHLPMFSHPHPERVLVIGAGDGGVLREVLKHDSVKEVVICEIDRMVIDVSKKYLPTVACCWDDPRVTLFCDDASKYIRSDKCKGNFDIVISDTSDPVGPAAPLFEVDFYKDLKAALRPGTLLSICHHCLTMLHYIAGVICTQCESIWNNLDLIEKLVRVTTPLFDSVEYGSTQIPTYPCGQIGFLVCRIKAPKGTLHFI